MSETKPAFPFHIMVKPHGPVCNLACRYCFYLHKHDMLETASTWRMTEATLELFTRQYIESQPAGQPVTFAWQGGEPTLMGIDFFRTAVALQKKYNPDGREIANSFQTNAMLIDDEWAQFFRENNFLIGVSIDGPKGIHNQYRVSRGNEGSFDRIMESVGILKAHKVEFNALTCVTNLTAGNALEIYRFLRRHFDFIQFIPIVEETGFREEAPFLKGAAKWRTRGGRSPREVVQSWCVAPADFGKFLCTVFDEWVRNDVGRTFVQIFDMTLGRWMGHPAGLCIFAPVCGKALVIEHDGTLYACDHFVYPEYRLGSIHTAHMLELVNAPAQRRFGEDKRDRLPAKCRACEFLPLCAGGCPKNRVITTAAGEPELNYLCEGYLAYFRHTAPYMQAMARLLNARRPAADIMDQLKAADLKQAGPNAPCPCGSGRKFKNCTCGLAGSKTARR